MLEILKEAFVDSLKLLPFLFIVYLFMEFIEHKSSKKTEEIIKKSGKFGPVIGSILGVFPQCGFSVMASNLYITRIISIGTLIAIYLSTSDEMLPVLLTGGASIETVLKFLLVKVFVGMFAGIVIDLFIERKNKKIKPEIEKICNHDHCHCEENLLLSTIKHTFNIFLFIFGTNLIMNFIIYIIGEDKISLFLTSNNFIGPILSSVIGLIPNCAASVIITELFLNNTLTFGSALSGLLASSGVGLLLLFRLNKNYKENLLVLSLVFFISIFLGIIFNLLNIAI